MATPTGSDYGGDPLGNQHGSGAQPQGGPMTFGGFARQGTPNFGGQGGERGRPQSERAGSRRRIVSEGGRPRGSSEGAQEPERGTSNKRSFEEVGGGDADNFERFFREMFNRFGGSGNRGGPARLREPGFLDDKRFAHIENFKGDHSKFRSFMFEFMVAVGRCSERLARELKMLYSRGPQRRDDVGGQF